MIKYLAFCMILISCNNQFLHQPSKSDVRDVIPECKDLVLLVNEYWFKHRKFSFHKDFSQVFTFANQCQKCFMNLHKADVIMMLGEPDIKTLTEFEYIFKKSHKGRKSLNYSSVIFQFTTNSVSNVEYVEHSIVE